MTTDEIRALLAAATPGPWDWNPDRHSGNLFSLIDGSIITDNGSDGGNYLPTIDVLCPDARLIAAAPTIAAIAITQAEEIERLRTQLAERDALGAVVMRESCAREAKDNAPAPVGGPFSHTNTARVTAFDIADCIRAIPIPTHAELLAHALTLPEIKALVAASILSKECFEFQFGVFRRYGCDFRMITPIKQLTAALAQMEGKE